MEVNLKLMKLTDKEYTKVEGEMQIIPYNVTVGLFMYAIVATRMVLVYVVNIISQFIFKARP